MERLNDNEVKEVVEMQKKIDSYEAFILCIHTMIANGKILNYPLFAPTPLEKNMNRVYKWVSQEIKTLVYEQKD